MPRTQREMIVRRIDQSRAALEKSIAYLLEIRAIYDPDYPDHVQAVDMMIAVLDQAHQLVEHFAELV